MAMPIDARVKAPGAPGTITADRRAAARPIARAMAAPQRGAQPLVTQVALSSRWRWEHHLRQGSLVPALCRSLGCMHDNPVLVADAGVQKAKAGNRGRGAPRQTRQLRK